MRPYVFVQGYNLAVLFQEKEDKSQLEAVS